MFDLSWLRGLFRPIPPSRLIEGVYADQYHEDQDQLAIRTRYQECWPDPAANPSPDRQPWLFDPCSPPEGWRYDPYYECWIKIDDR